MRGGTSRGEALWLLSLHAVPELDRPGDLLPVPCVVLHSNERAFPELRLPGEPAGNGDGPSVFQPDHGVALRRRKALGPYTDDPAFDLVGGQTASLLPLAGLLPLDRGLSTRLRTQPASQEEEDSHRLPLCGCLSSPFGCESDAAADEQCGRDSQRADHAFARSQPDQGPDNSLVQGYPRHWRTAALAGLPGGPPALLTLISIRHQRLLCKANFRVAVV